MPASGGLLRGSCAVFALIPETAEGVGWLIALALAGCGYGLLEIFDRAGLPVCPSCSHSQGFSGPLLAATAVHALVDGWGMTAVRTAGCSSLLVGAAAAQDSRRAGAGGDIADVDRQAGARVRTGGARGVAYPGGRVAGSLDGAGAVDRLSSGAGGRRVFISGRACDSGVAAAGACARAPRPRLSFRLASSLSFRLPGERCTTTRPLLVVRSMSGPPAPILPSRWFLPPAKLKSERMVEREVCAFSRAAVSAGSSRVIEPLLVSKRMLFFGAFARLTSTEPLLVRTRTGPAWPRP